MNTESKNNRGRDMSPMLKKIEYLNKETKTNVVSPIRIVRESYMSQKLKNIVKLHTAVPKNILDIKSNANAKLSSDYETR